MQDFKDVLSELDTLVTKITSSERSKNNFTSMLDEQLNSINSSLSMLEQVDVKLSHMITGFMLKLKLCNDDLAAEQTQKSEIEVKRQQLAAEIESMKINAEIASAQTEEERRRLIEENQRELERHQTELAETIREADTKLEDLGSYGDQIEEELRLEREKSKNLNDKILRTEEEADEALSRLGTEYETQINRQNETIATQLSAFEQERVAAETRIMKITEKLAETKKDMQALQSDKALLTAEKETNEQQIQQLNEVSAMSQEELEAFKVKNKQDLTSAKDQMETLDKKIKELESELDEKNKTLTEGVAAIKRVIGMLQQFVTDDDSADTSISSKNEEIRTKIKKQMEVIRTIEEKLDNSGLGESTKEFTENPMRAASSDPPSPELQQEDTPFTTPPQLKQFKNQNPLSQSTRKNRSQRNVTNVSELGNIGDDPNKKGGTRKKSKRRRSSQKRRCTKRKRNQKKRKATRRKRRKQNGGYTYSSTKTSV
jgi:hypothetical protein